MRKLIIAFASIFILLSNTACSNDQGLKPSGDEYLKEIQKKLDYYEKHKEQISLTNAWSIQSKNDDKRKNEPYANFSVYFSIGEPGETMYAPYKNVGMHLDANEKKLIYQYTSIKKIDGDGTSVTVTYKSDYDDLRTYDVESKTEVYEDGKKVKGSSEMTTITLDEDHEVNYEDISNLRESIRAINNFLNDFQAIFEIDLSKYNFYDMPEILAEKYGTAIEEPKEYTPIETINDYYSSMQHDSKGLRYYHYLEATSIPGLAGYGKYDVDRGNIAEHYNITLDESDVEHCYDMTISGNRMVNYVYIKDGAAYFYDLDIGSRKKIEDDVLMMNGSKADIILELRESPTE